MKWIMQLTVSGDAKEIQLLKVIQRHLVEDILLYDMVFDTSNSKTMISFPIDFSP